MTDPHRPPRANALYGGSQLHSGAKGGRTATPSAARAAASRPRCISRPTSTAISFDLTGGEAGDAPHFEVLLGLGPEIEPRAALGNKGYDSRANRAACRSRGIVPVIPYRTTTRDRPARFPKALYKGRARIEQSVGKLNRFKRIALRCEKTKTSFLSFIALAAGFILIKSVHTT